MKLKNTINFWKITLIFVLFSSFLLTFTSCETPNADFNIYKVVNNYWDYVDEINPDTTLIYMGDTLYFDSYSYAGSHLWDYNNLGHNTDYYNLNESIKYSSYGESILCDTAGTFIITHTAFSYTMRQEAIATKEVTILPSVMLTVTVLDNLENSVEETVVQLFDPEAPNEENPIRIDITNYSGRVSFNHLEAKEYFIFAQKGLLNNSEADSSIFLQEGKNEINIIIN